MEEWVEGEDMEVVDMVEECVEVVEDMEGIEEGDMEEDTAAAGITDMVPAGFPMPGSLRTGFHPLQSSRKNQPPLRSAERTSTAPIAAVRF